VLGDFRRLFATATALAEVSAEDLQRAIAGTLVPERRSVVIIDPDLEDDEEEEDAQ
jgi:hypothetical protein